jgi:hypothetical protein
MDPSTATDEQAWLTAVLRPAGPLEAAAVRKLGAALGQLAAASDMVLLDLTAAVVRDPRALAGALREPAALFDRGGRCLLVVGAPGRLVAELDRAAVPVVLLAAEALPAEIAALPAQVTPLSAQVAVRPAQVAA